MKTVGRTLPRLSALGALAFLGMAFGGCAVEIGEAGETEGDIGEAALAFTIDSSMITVTESPADKNLWPKTIKWCVNATHATHSPKWRVSWSSNLLSSDAQGCVSTTVSAEQCNLSAMIDYDALGHTGDINNPKKYSVFDHRDPIAIAPSSYSLAINGCAQLTAPAPHGTKHCDGTGSFVWQVKNASGVWYDITASANIAQWSTCSGTAGTETYRLKSTHKGYTSYSNTITVTWSNNTSCTAQVTCPSGYQPYCTSSTGNCSQTQYSVMCDGWGDVCPNTISCVKPFECDSYCGTGMGWCNNGYCMCPY